MAVIKNGQRVDLARGAAVIDHAEVRRQGRSIVDHARAEGERLIARAHQEVREIVHTAAERGRAEGMARGLDEGRARGRAEGRREALDETRAALSALEHAWRTVLEGWDISRRQLLSDARADVICFAIAIAEKVIHRAIEHDPSLVIDQIAGALSLVLHQSRLAIAVNPADRALVEEALPALAEVAKGCNELSIVERDDVPPGGCMITTAGGCVDARIGTQIDRIAHVLLPASRNVIGALKAAAGNAA